MAQNQYDDQDSLKKALDLFLKAKQDERSVTEVEQPLQIHIVGSQAYIPSYTRSVLDKNFGAPVMAIYTRTEADSKTVFIYPAKTPDARGAKKLRSTETMGAAYVAFGVPLRKIGVKLNISRRVILTLNILEVPNEGTVYWASFADIDKERRHIDTVAIAAAKQEKVAKAKARKESRAKKSSDSAPTETSN
jgi:hypothetical protein